MTGKELIDIVEDEIQKVLERGGRFTSSAVVELRVVPWNDAWWAPKGGVTLGSFVIDRYLVDLMYEDPPGPLG